jgi:hypothetical protein
MSSKAHSTPVTVAGKMRCSSQTATAKRPRPNRDLTAFIQAPALGSSLPAEVPMASSGTPMPMPMANKAMPPSRASPVWPM